MFASVFLNNDFGYYYINLDAAINSIEKLILFHFEKIEIFTTQIQTYSEILFISSRELHDILLSSCSKVTHNRSRFGIWLSIVLASYLNNGILCFLSWWKWLFEASEISMLTNAIQSCDPISIGDSSISKPKMKMFQFQIKIRWPSALFGACVHRNVFDMTMAWPFIAYQWKKYNFNLFLPENQIIKRF